MYINQSLIGDHLENNLWCVLNLVALWFKLCLLVVHLLISSYSYEGRHKIGVKTVTSHN